MRMLLVRGSARAEATHRTVGRWSSSLIPGSGFLLKPPLPRLARVRRRGRGQDRTGKAPQARGSLRGDGSGTATCRLDGGAASERHGECDDPDPYRKVVGHEKTQCLAPSGGQPAAT